VSIIFKPIKLQVCAKHQWFILIILATQEEEIRRITVQSQPRQIVQETPISKITKAK
jgi:hypothetical protein